MGDLSVRHLDRSKSFDTRSIDQIASPGKGNHLGKGMADATIELPDTLECLEPLMATVPLQLLAYYIAVCKDKDVDQPRNLAKSVTVE